MQKKSPRQLYWKLFLIYSILIIGIVLALVIYFISTTSRRIKETNLDYTRMVCEKAEDFVKSASYTADYIMNDLYQSQEELRDLSQYLNQDIESYIDYRMETYSNSPLLTYRGFDQFAEKAIESNSNIKRIQVLSYRNQELTTYLPEGKNYRGEDKEQLKESVKNQDFAKKGEFSFMKEIREPDNLKNIGCLLITFDGEKLDEIHGFFKKAEFMMYNQHGTVVYSTLSEEKSRQITQLKNSNIMEKVLTGTVFYQEVKDYSILSALPNRQSGDMSRYSFWMIIGLGVGGIVFGEILIHYYLKRLTLRLNRILQGMDEVTKGNLKVRIITEEKKDELDVIAGHFNQMCQELDTYIAKSYQAEIDQRSAEMAALQSQINPHFLYNTLESIRMKAICNGDREVGKMLYGLAVLFRSQIKEKDVITLAQELHYCKKYLELFEFRYQKKFHTKVECPEEYMQVPVIKFIVQPIIENYFEHGIRMEDSDNYLYIEVKKMGSVMKICVEDNGYGMSVTELAKKNEELSANMSSHTASIGLTNVNRRLKAAYGLNYGVSIQGKEQGGIIVTLSFPHSGGEENEESNVSRG